MKKVISTILITTLILSSVGSMGALGEDFDSIDFSPEENSILNLLYNDSSFDLFNTFKIKDLTHLYLTFKEKYAGEFYKLFEVYLRYYFYLYSEDLKKMIDREEYGKFNVIIYNFCLEKIPNKLGALLTDELLDKIRENYMINFNRDNIEYIKNALTLEWCNDKYEFNLLRHIKCFDNLYE